MLYCGSSPAARTACRSSGFRTPISTSGSGQTSVVTDTGGSSGADANSWASSFGRICGAGAHITARVRTFVHFDFRGFSMSQFADRMIWLSTKLSKICSRLRQLCQAALEDLEYEHQRGRDAEDILRPLVSNPLMIMCKRRLCSFSSGSCTRRGRRYSPPTSARRSYGEHRINTYVINLAGFERSIRVGQHGIFPSRHLFWVERGRGFRNIREREKISFL